MNDTKIYIPLSKVDKEKRMVYGYATTDTKDCQGEIVAKEAVKKAWDDYMKWANVREMHQPSAVGVTKEYEFDDKGVQIGVKVVDDNAWKKVKEGVYKGFSIGGRVIEQVGDTIKGLILYEISLVDRPANPQAVFSVIKRDEIEKAKWTTAFINNLPDAAFAVIESGGKKDDTGKTEPRSLRHLPHHNASVKSASENSSVDIPHLRNALARLPQTKLSSDLKKKAYNHLAKHAKALLESWKIEIEPFGVQIGYNHDELNKLFEEVENKSNEEETIKMANKNKNKKVNEGVKNEEVKTEEVEVKTPEKDNEVTVENEEHGTIPKSEVTVENEVHKSDEKTEDKELQGEENKNPVEATTGDEGMSEGTSKGTDKETKEVKKDVREMGALADVVENLDYLISAFKDNSKGQTSIPKMEQAKSLLLEAVKLEASEPKGKSQQTEDLNKAYIAKVENLEKIVGSLKEQIEELKNSPKADVPQASYIVEKSEGSQVDAKTEMENIKKEIDKTYKEAQNLVEEPNPDKEAELQTKLDDLQTKYFRLKSKE